MTSASSLKKAEVTPQPGPSQTLPSHTLTSQTLTSSAVPTDESLPQTSLPTESLPVATRDLVDQHGRVHRELRISITDVCNIRCQYCMPEVVQFLQREKHLTVEQIIRFVQCVVPLGVHRFRITGGEPLVRNDLPEIIQGLRQTPGVEEVGLTTNATLLEDQIERLVEVGLQRINISLDTLSDQRFQQLSRRSGIDRVLRGIAAALRYPQLQIKLNALVLRDINLEEVVDLVSFAKDRGVTIRFIEFMPLDGDRAWSKSRMVSGDELRALLTKHFGELQPASRRDLAQPATDYHLATGGTVGFIDSVSRPFCSACDRIRLTSDGKIRNCLFGSEEWDVAQLLKSGAPASQVQQVVLASVAAKHPSHGIASPTFQPPQRAMYQIGG